MEQLTVKAKAFLLEL